MTLDEFKSPLPPRKTEEVLIEEPVVKTEVTENVVETASEEPKYENKKPAFKVDKKILMIVGGVILAVVIIFFLVKFILGNLTGKTKDVTLNYWGLWEDSPVLQGIIADYETKNPGVKINYRMEQKADYRTRLQGRLEKDPGGADEVPDIFRFHSSWLPMLKNDLVAVPTETVKNIGLDSDFFDVYKNDLTIDGRYFGVPLMYDGLALFYNKDLVNAAADVQLPKSWWDLEAAAAKLTVRDTTGQVKVAGAAIGLVDNVDQWSDIVGLMLKQSGADILVNDDATNKKIEDVLTFYTLFLTKDKVWDQALPGSTELFAKGKLAFYFGPSWRAFNIEDMKVPGLNYAVTSVPQLPTLEGAASSGSVDPNASLTNIQWSSYWAEGVNPKSKNQAEAWKFVAYMSTKDVLEKMYTAASQIRAFGEIYPRKSMAGSLSSNLQIKPFIDAANDAGTGYLASRTSDDKGLNDNMMKYFGDAINSMVLKNQTADQVIGPLRDGIEQLKARYSLK